MNKDFVAHKECQDKLEPLDLEDQWGQKVKLDPLDRQVLQEMDQVDR